MGFFRGTYAEGFAPRDFAPRYPGLWTGCVFACRPGLGPTGGVLRDWSGRKQDGTLTGFTLASAWALNAGQYSLAGNGSASYVDHGTSVMSNWNGANKLSFSFWAAAGSQVIKAIAGNFDGATMSWFIETSVAGTGLLVAMSTADFGQVDAILSTTMTHYCIVYDGTQSTNATKLLIYSGGIQKTVSFTGTIPTTIASGSAAFRLLADTEATPSRFFTGNADDFMGWTRALSPQEVALLSTRRGIAYEWEKRNLLMTSLKAGGAGIFTGGTLQSRIIQARGAA